MGDSGTATNRKEKGFGATTSDTDLTTEGNSHQNSVSRGYSLSTTGTDTRVERHHAGYSYAPPGDERSDRTLATLGIHQSDKRGKHTVLEENGGSQIWEFIKRVLSFTLHMSPIYREI